VREHDRHHGPGDGREQPLPGRKDANTCPTGSARVNNATSTLTALPACAGGRSSIAASAVTAWGGMVQIGIDPVSVPTRRSSSRSPDGLLGPGKPEDRARPDVRDAGARGAGRDRRLEQSQVRHLATCGAVGTSTSFYDNREGSSITMLDVNVQALLTCNKLSQILDAPCRSTAARRSSSSSRWTPPTPPAEPLRDPPAQRGGAEHEPPVRAVDADGADRGLEPAGLHPGELQHDLKKPRGGARGHDQRPVEQLGGRVERARARVARADLDGDRRGPLRRDRHDAGGGESGQDGGHYNGGLEGFLRLHENWNGTVALTYGGSFVSLFAPRHVQGAFTYGAPCFTGPVPDWAYELGPLRGSGHAAAAHPELLYLRHGAVRAELRFLTGGRGMDTERPETEARRVLVGTLHGTFEGA